MLGSQRGHGVMWQVCLAHLLRDAKYAIECGDTAFSAPFRWLLLRAIAIGRRRETLKDTTLKQYLYDLDRRLDRILAVVPIGEPGRKLHKRMRANRAHLFVFMSNRAVPPTNNISERHLRPSVIFRKVTNGFRCEWGAQTYAAFRSVVSTAKANREALDRLSRDQEDVAALYKRIRFAGIRLVTKAEGEVSELHVGLKGTMNSLFLQDLAAKTHRGLAGRVEDGFSGGGNSYGYRVVRRLGPDGHPATGERSIDPAQAAVVRRIFAFYARGDSPKRIALTLNAEGVPAPKGKHWSSSTLNGNRARGTGILNNELYIGRLVWNRLTYLRDPDTRKRRSRPRDAADLTVTEVPDLRIVEQALWDAVKHRQALLDRPEAANGPRGWRRVGRANQAGCGDRI